MDSYDNFAFVLPVTMLTFGLVFLFLARRGARPALWWGLGFVSAAIGFTIPILPLPLHVLALSANLFFLAAFNFYGQALLVRLNGPTVARERATFSILAFMAIAYAVLIERSLKAELLLSDIACTVLLVWPLVLVARRAKLPIDRLLVGIMSIMVLESVLRVFTISYLVASGSGLEAFFASRYAFVTQVSANIIAVGFGLTALAAIALDVIDKYRVAAEIDPLTGLFNRRGFERSVTALGPLTTARAVVQCDIDHFKHVNDSFGHSTGDLILIGIADMLRAHLPENAIAARFGGEEFVVVLPEYSLADGEEFAHRLRRTLSRHDWRKVGVGRQITASFGVACQALSDYSINDAITRADHALYSAKAAGRNRVMLEDRGSPLPVMLNIVPRAS